MKQISKKLISIVLSAAMALTMVPVIPGLSSEAYAAEAGNLWVGGVKMTDGKYLAEGKTTTTSTKPSGGYAYYKDGVLTLNDYSYEGAGYEYSSYEDDDGEVGGYSAALYSDGNINIKLIGYNEIIGTDDVLGTDAVGVSSDNGDGILSIYGNGTLSAEGDEIGIFAEEINIQNAEVYVYAEEYDALVSYGDINIVDSIVYTDAVGDACNSIYGNNINIENSEVYAFATDAEAICALENLSITDGSMVLANSEYYDGIYVCEDMKVADSEVDAGGYYNGIYIEEGDLYVDNSEVYGVSYEDEEYGGINLDYGDVYTDGTVRVAQNTTGESAKRWNQEYILNYYDFVSVGNAARLSTPTNVKVNNNATSGKPKVTWKAVGEATKYYIYRSTSKNGTYSYMYSTTGTSYTNTSAVAGKTYYYKVKAVDSYNSSYNSYMSSPCYITCDLAQPTNVKVNNVASSGKPKVTWNKVDGASKYYIYRSTSKNGKYSYMYSTTGTSYTNTSAVAGKTYYYKVKAIHPTTEYGNSALSNPCYITCDLARPVVSITLSSGKPKISWKAVSGASKYEVYRKAGVNGTYSKYYTTTSTSMKNTSAKAGTKYYYQVVAVCGSSSYGNSAKSTAVSITSK